MTIWLARFLLIFFLSCSLHLIHSWGNLTSHPNPLHHQNTHLLPSGQLKEQEILLTVTGNQSNPAPLPADELGALHDLYNATIGEYWIWTGVPWNFTESNPDPCSEGWEGVTCNTVCDNSSNCEEHVHSIILSHNNMSGSLPDSLQQLQQLQKLSITGNHKLTGSIPSSLSSLSYLIYLVLDSNGLSGSIPSSLTNVKSLAFLDLSENDLTGILPTNLSQLTGLSYFYIYSNHLSGSMPGDIGTWSQLSYLYAYSNLISGEFPESIANCSLLNTFSIHNNFMTGHLPPSVSKLKSLTYFGVFYNMLSGSIPDDVGTASAMLFISLDTNFFTGTLPSSIGQLSALAYFSVYDNILWGSLPSTIYDLSSITDISLSSNTFSGSLSSAIGQWTAMTYLDLSSNIFTGSLPGALGQLEKLEFFSVSSNVLSGTLPAELENWKNIVELYLSVNLFEGTIPAFIGNMSALSYLYWESCLLTGALPSEMISLEKLYVWDAINNSLSGTIPEFMTTMSTLVALALGNNHFYGSLPANFGRLAELQDLTLAYNGFSGSLPASFSTLSNLQAASLACNFLSGSLSSLSIPSSHLDYLNISNNYFTGETSPLLSLQNISILDISSNGLTGSFQVHEKMPKLVWLFLRGNELSGSLSGTFTSLSTPSLVYLDLSNNRFSGAFPASDFAQLTKLNTLAAVENCFTGTISSDLCKASKLQVAALDGLSAAPSCRRATLSSSDGTLSSWVPSYVMGKHAVHGSLPSCLFQELNVLVTLHLSGNSLKGTIPDLAKHSLLSDLSLSHNELSGTVPDSVQSNSWINLDLSFNKLTGILKNSMSSTDWANASIALDINRLSGKIPSDYYHIGDVDMLRGNIFQCPDDGNDEESLPPSDPYNNQYGCGSEKLNTALIIWGSVVVCLGVVCVCIAGSMKMRSSRQREDVKSKYSKDIACCGKRKQNEEKEVSEDVGEGEDLEKRGEGATSKDEEKGKSSAQSATCWDRFLDKVEMMRKQMEEWQSVYGGENDEVKDALRRQDNTYRGEGSHVDEAHADAEREAHPINNPVAVLRSQIVMVGQLSRFVRQFSSVAMLLIVLLGVPLYTTLSYFYGSYYYQYGWTPSAAFLSGESAAIALLILFLGIAASLAFFITSRGFSSFYHADDQQNGRHVSIKWWWYGWSVACESSESWRYFLRVLVIVAGNIAVVMVVNASFVYLYVQISVLQSFFLSVAMTGFKLVWSRILFLVLSHWIARARGRKQTSRPTEGPSDNATNTIDGVKNNLTQMMNGWNSATITIYSCLMLFNTIVAPCLATLFISSDCFYYVFVSPPYVAVSYSYLACIAIIRNTCVSAADVIKTSDFQPPFSYGYQCSSALLQEYGYVFVYKYLLLGVLHPLVVLLLTFYHDQQTSSDESGNGNGNGNGNDDGAEKKEEGPMAERGVAVSDELISPLHIRSGDVAIDAKNTSPKPKVMTSSKVSCFAFLLPPLWRKNISHGIMSYFLDETNFEHVFSAAEYSVRLSMMIGTLLTYGIVLPYLAVLVCVAIVSNTYLTQWALARFYQMAWKASENNHHDRLSSSLRLHSNDSKMSATVPESEWNADGSREAVRHVKVVSFSSSCSSVRTDNQALVVQHVSDECEQLPAALLVAARPLSVLMLFFLSCFLFDIAGDKGGAWIGLYFVLVMCLVPLLAVIVHRLWLGWMERRRLMHEEVVRNQASREGRNGIELVNVPVS